MSPDNLVYSWIVVVAGYVASMAWILWHWPALSKMGPLDKLVRWGVLSAILAVSTANLWTILGHDSIWRRPWLAASFLCIAIGMLGLLWKYRRNRSTAALDVQVGQLRMQQAVQSDTTQILYVQEPEPKEET